MNILTNGSVEGCNPSDATPVSTPCVRCLIPQCAVLQAKAAAQPGMRAGSGEAARILDVFSKAEPATLTDHPGYTTRS